MEFTGANGVGAAVLWTSLISVMIALPLSFAVSFPPLADVGSTAELVVDNCRGCGAGEADLRETRGVERVLVTTVVVYTVTVSNVLVIGADEVGAEGEETEGVSNSGGRF